MKNKLSVPQSIDTPPQTPPPPAQPDNSTSWVVAEHSQQSHLQVPPAPAYNPQRTVLHPSRPSTPEQSGFYTNDAYGSQWHGQQHQYQPPPVAQPLTKPVAHPNLHQPTAGYPLHQSVTSPQPQLAYYPRAQPQQQKHLRQTPLQDPVIHAPSPPQSQFPPPTPSIRNAAVYPGQSQGSGRVGDGWLNNMHLNANKRGQGGNHGRKGGRVPSRGGSMAGNRGETAERGRGGGYIGSGSGGRRGGQSGVGVRVHESRGNYGRAASIQVEGRNINPTSAEPAAAAVPVVAQLQGAHAVNISGNTRFTNIGMNMGNLTTVNNYGGSHGLEKLEKFVSFAALHDSAEQDPDRRCHPGTRETVLTRLRDWFDNPNATNPIVWLHGPAGAGKSAIAQSIAQEYKERGLAATFFFYRSDAERSDGNRLFPTIAWQLAFSILAIKDFIVYALDRTPHIPRKDVETQFEQLVAHPFQAMNSIASQMPHFASVVIIDGVDECSIEQLQRRILTVIGNTVKDCSVPLRFLVCSRPETLIEETLDQFKDSTLCIDLATLDDSHRDIEKYLVDEFSAIVSKQGLNPTWPSQLIIEEIVFQSSGNFILPSTLIRFISDEDYSPESQLDIVRKLRPQGKISPFAFLDELYLEILKRPLDQDFLRTFLALLVGRSSIEQDNLHEDDATLMNVSDKVLHNKLRKMCSLLKFKPFIDVYHKSFLDFLQDSSRSGQYHVSKQAGLQRYLELVVDSVIRHVSMAIEQPNHHETCRFTSGFKDVVEDYPPKIVLPVEGWQEALKPLLDLQDKLLTTSKPKPCRVTQVIRDLLMHLVLLQGKSHRIAAIHVSGSSTNETVTEWSPVPVTEATQIIPETDLDNCLSALLSCLQKSKPNLIMVVDGAIIDHMSSLLAFDYTEIAARVRSVSDAQKLIDLIDLLINNELFLSQCGPSVARKAAHLTSIIFARVPILPLSPFLNRPARHFNYLGTTLEFICQNVFISKILDHNYILPVLEIYDEPHELYGGFENANEETELINEWLERSSPTFITRTTVMLEIARIIRYIHSMDITLHSSYVTSKYFSLDSNLHAKFMFRGLFAWWSEEASIYGHETFLLGGCTNEGNISAFANFFDAVCLRDDNENTPNRLVDDARQLIDRCRAKDSKRQPTMVDVVKEMETWNLT